MRSSRVLVVTLLSLLLVVSFVSCAYSELEKEHCVHHCLKFKVDSAHHCRMSCDYKSTLPPLEVFVDGVRIPPKDDHHVVEEMSDSSFFNVGGVNFDKNFYNTPSAFNDIIAMQSELMDRFYHAASSHFVTPGKSYAAGTMVHLLNVPIPLTDAQFNNQDFMNKLLDIVPKESNEYKPASTVPMSDVYKDFLYNIRVDQSALDGAPSPAQQQHIKRMEGNMQIVLSQYMDFAERCYIAYETHLYNNMLSPISYTMDSYTPHNSDCQNSVAKLNDYTRMTKELSDYIANTNVYNQLFQAIGLLRQANRDWTYSRDEIQQFTQYHRNLENSGQQPPSGQFSVPIQTSKRILNNQLFGSTSEVEFNGQLRFSGIGWKESSVYPSSSWFNINVLNKYRGNPLNNPKDYFGFHGRLNRIPTHILVAYKPELRIRISRTMKERFESTTQQRQYRKPIESGSFVFTNVNIHTVQGTNANEEYEMVFSANMQDPQIIGFKSHSIVQYPPYMQYVNKLVKIESVASGTIISWPSALANLNFGFGFGGWGGYSPQPVVDIERPTQTLANAAESLYSPVYEFFIKNAGESKVALVSPMGTSMRIDAGGNGQPVRMKNELLGSFKNTIEANEKFHLEQHGAHWVIKSALHGTYIRADPGGAGKLFSSQAHIDNYCLFNIRTQPDQSTFKFIDKMITLRSTSGQYLKANDGEGASVGTQGHVDPTTIWRMEYYGGQRISLVSNFGTYLKVQQAEAFDFTTPQKQIILGSSFESNGATLTMTEANGRFTFTIGGLEMRPVTEHGSTFIAKLNANYQATTQGTSFAIEIIE